MATLNQIKEFLEPKKMAIAGVSRDEKKFGHHVFKALKENGYDICPINPNADKINDVKCYASINEIPEEYDRLYIVTSNDKTLELVQQASDRGIKKIWIQSKSENKEIIDYVKEKEIDAIYKKCIFMFADPVEGGHKFHRTLVKIFGGYPR